MDTMHTGILDTMDTVAMSHTVEATAMMPTAPRSRALEEGLNRAYSTGLL